MKIFIYISFLLILFVGCARQKTSISDKSQMILLGQLLEKNYEVANDCIVEVSNNTLENPSPNLRKPLPQLFLKQAEIKNYRLKQVVVHDANSINLMAKVKVVDPSMEKKLVYSTKTEKIEKENTESKGISNRLRNGIILGAVGLGMIILAGFFGAAAPIIYVAGAIIFIVGMVIILLEIL